MRQRGSSGNHNSGFGEFEFLALPPGTYTLTAEKEGFNKYQRTSLQLLVNVPTTVKLTLKVGAVATQVESRHKQR